MAKVSKKLADIQIGDVYYVPKTVICKEETVAGWKITFDDGSFIEFEKSGDPALLMGE